MILGYNPVETEEMLKSAQEIKRIYIEVIVDWLPDGRIIPLSFTWTDGREHRIDKVLSVVKGHSLKVPAPGLRYRCRTGRRDYYLHYDGERWYVEK